MLEWLDDWFYTLWPVALALINFAVAVSCTAHIVLRKRDVRAAIGWAGLVWLAPLLGAIAYVCFGINRIQRRAVALNVSQRWASAAEPSESPEDAEIRERLAAEYPNLAGLAALVRRLTGNPVLPGNRVMPLVDGDEAYPAMLDAIESAKRSVSLLSYIFDGDRAGDRFVEALRKAHLRGVEIRVLIDDVGARYSRVNVVERLRSLGVRADSFLPTRLPRLFKYANLRNHRKILVVDGRVGFTGGTNIREGHWLSLNPSAPVQCVHFQLDGPVVAHLQRVFALDWAFATDELLQGDLWFPAIERAGPVWARGIPDGPDEDFEKLTDTMLGALTSATRRVRLATPYFLPDATLIRGLNVAALRGVDVRIYVPGQNNVPLVAWASRAQFWQLLEKGCRIFLTAPPFDHTKLFVVDEIWSLIGSTNWDPRSLRLNFEFNVECYDSDLASRLSQLIDAKESQAREITLDDAANRRAAEQLRDGLARLLMPYL